uniref:F-box domain-containing protein n=1 Tax=Pristionchus pacificus TaxID=54126 RepID=A0A2A6C5U9_PRIPA|eukprot:PDM73534.1 F-box domain-containing protein [Pristionchus pacificus]
MVADDSDYSDNEIYDEVWPEDYFASDVEDCSLEALDLNDPSPAELVPIEILRKIVEPLGLRDRCSLSLVNRAFRKAVQASTWHVHRLAITSNEEDVPRNRSVMELSSRGIVLPPFSLQRRNAAHKWSVRDSGIEFLLGHLVNFLLGP